VSLLLLLLPAAPLAAVVAQALPAPRTQCDAPNAGGPRSVGGAQPPQPALVPSIGAMGGQGGSLGRGRGGDAYVIFDDPRNPPPRTKTQRSAPLAGVARARGGAPYVPPVLPAAGIYQPLFLFNIVAPTPVLPVVQPTWEVSQPPAIIAPTILAPDEDFWSAYVLALPIFDTTTSLLATTQWLAEQNEVVPFVAPTFAADDDWSPLAPIPVPWTAPVFTEQGDTPALYGQPDEDFWLAFVLAQSPTPVLAVTHPLSINTWTWEQNEPAGSLFGQPDED